MALLLGFLPALSAHADESAPTVESLLRQSLAVAPGMEVIVSRVVLPPSSRLPVHWHPGEEFGVVLEGRVTLWLEGEEKGSNGPGEAVAIPLGAKHTAITGAEGATLLVFRVHPEGEPERVLVTGD